MLTHMRRMHNGNMILWWCMLGNYWFEKAFYLCPRGDPRGEYKNWNLILIIWLFSIYKHKLLFKNNKRLLSLDRLTPFSQSCILIGFYYLDVSRLLEYVQNKSLPSLMALLFNNAFCLFRLMKLTNNDLVILLWIYTKFAFLIPKTR